MRKRRGITIFFSVYMVMVFSVVAVFAEDNNDNGETNNLNLNTEILNNKKEEVNSNTTIGNIKLFSADYKTTLEQENTENKKYYSDVYESVFTKEAVVDNDQKENVNIFGSKVVFDKNVIDASKNYDFMPMFIIIVLVLMLLTYILTKRKYLEKAKVENNSANYNNVYE